MVYPDDNFYLSYSLAKLCSEISKLKTGKGHITIVSTERDELRNTSLIRGAYASDDVILLEKRNYPDAFLDRLGRTISEMSVSGIISLSCQRKYTTNYLSRFTVSLKGTHSKRRKRYRHSKLCCNRLCGR